MDLNTVRQDNLIRTRGRCATEAIVNIDPFSASTKKTQIEESIRNAISELRLRPGFRVPSTRNLASSLGISRNTVGAAYDELVAEGYLEPKEGSGTYVSEVIKEISSVEKDQAFEKDTSILPSVSARAMRGRDHDVTVVPQEAGPGVFRPGVPYIDPLSSKTWIKLAKEAWREKQSSAQLYGDLAGAYRLRTVITDFLGTHRGMKCSPDQVIIVNGSQQGLNLAFQLVADPGQSIWVTDPSRTGVKAALVNSELNPSWFLSSELGCRPLPRGNGELPRALCISPNSQFPMGARLSLQQRRALLAEVSAANAWVIEDEFDGDFQYLDQPVLPLHALDKDDRTIYVGSFSRSLFPSIRIGYLVVPERSLDCVSGLKSLGDRNSSTWLQATLARFIEEGHYWRHLRRAQRLYANRQDRLVRAIQNIAPNTMTAEPSEGGMHLLAEIKNMGDRQAEQISCCNGIDSVALSRFKVDRSLPQALLLGFSIAEEQEIESNVRRLSVALASGQQN